MTKSELIEKIAERFPFLSNKDSEIIINTVFDSMIETLAQGGRVEIRGFGSFAVRKREARIGRNPKTGQSVEIPAKGLPFFKVGKELSQRINTPDA